MNKYALISSAAAFALLSGVAGAATLKNTDKMETKVGVEMDGKKHHVKLKEGESFDSKDKGVTFVLGKEKAVSAKADEHYLIKGGKIEQEKPEVKAETPTVTEKKAEPAKVEPAPATKIVAPEHK